MRMLLLYALFFILPLPTFAQTAGESFFNSDLTLELSPSAPSPFENFTATLNDYNGGGYGATIDWYYNGSRLENETNKRSVNLQAGAGGIKTELKAVLTTPNGGVETITQSVTPVFLDIIIEPQTHVPSFYQGRPLPSPGSTVNATVLLSTDTLLPNNYLYTWKVDDVVIDGGPLRNGNRISFTMPESEGSILSVHVARLDGSTLAKRSISLPAVMPRLLFYEVNTLYGVSEKAISNSLAMLSDSTAVRAEPYYLDSEIFNNPPIADWKINNTAVTVGNNPYEITLERTGNTGPADINFRVQSTTKLLQGAKSTFIIDVSL